VPENFKHGTNRGYGVYKCRCDDCRVAHSEAARIDRERNNARVTAAQRRRWREDPKYRQYQAEWRAENREQVLAWKREYYVRHREQLLEQDKVRYQRQRQRYIDNAKRWREANPERSREIARGVRERHREEYNLRAAERARERYASDPDKYKVAFKRWRLENPEAARLTNQRNRHKRRGAEFTAEAIEWIASLVDPLCTYCGERADTIDHIIPVSKGGTGEVDNLTPACRSCNSKKHTMTLEAFMQKMGMN